MREPEFNKVERADVEGKEGEGQGRERRGGERSGEKKDGCEKDEGTLTGCDDVRGQRKREEGRDPRLEVAREYSPLRVRELVAHAVARDCIRVRIEFEVEPGTNVQRSAVSLCPPKIREQVSLLLVPKRSTSGSASIHAFRLYTTYSRYA